jgi:hypothetical protein
MAVAARFRGAGAKNAAGHSSRAGREQYDAPMTAALARPAIHRDGRGRTMQAEKSTLGALAGGGGNRAVAEVGRFVRGRNLRASQAPGFR